MWVYLGSSSPDYPPPKELSVGEVEARIHKVLDSTIIASPGIGPDALRRGITSIRVSTLGLISTAFMILSFHYAQDLAQSLGDGCDESRDVDPSANALGQEARHANNGAARTSEEGEGDWHGVSQAARKWGTEVPTRYAPSCDREMERG
jgi:hypothetical protein